jgi:hypothetical protein
VYSLSYDKSFSNGDPKVVGFSAHRRDAMPKGQPAVRFEAFEIRTPQLSTAGSILNFKRKITSNILLPNRTGF